MSLTKLSKYVVRLAIVRQATDIVVSFVIIAMIAMAIYFVAR